MKQEGELEIRTSTSDKEGTCYVIWDDAFMVYRGISLVLRCNKLS